MSNLDDTLALPFFDDGHRCFAEEISRWAAAKLHALPHDDHFHVRLRCPTGDAECQVQEPIPPGDGCGADLAWWFTAEARRPPPRTGGKVPLPVACDEILKK